MTFTREQGRESVRPALPVAPPAHSRRARAGLVQLFFHPAEFFAALEPRNERGWVAFTMLLVAAQSLHLVRDAQTAVLALVMGGIAMAVLWGLGAGFFLARLRWCGVNVADPAAARRVYLVSHHVAVLPGAAWAVASLLHGGEPTGGSSYTLLSSAFWAWSSWTTMVAARDRCGAPARKALGWFFVLPAAYCAMMGVFAVMSLRAWGR